MTCPICRQGLAADCTVCGFHGREGDAGIFEALRSPSAELEYPHSGYDELFPLEDISYWFRHRAAIIESAVRRWPWRPPLLDVGGGNGFQAQLLSKLGDGVVLVEPGVRGCENAAARGVVPIVRSTLEALQLREESVGAIALFDVLEHLALRESLLAEARRVLRKGGRLYLTVPALGWLWSAEDVRAEHKLRYTATRLRAELLGQAFEVEHLTYFFLPLVAPILALRTLFSLTGIDKARLGYEREHSGSGIAGKVLRQLLGFEARWLARGHALPFGSSLLCVARKTSSYN